MEAPSGHGGVHSVRCLVTDGCPHDHVVAVETGWPGMAPSRWTIVGVIAAIRNDATFEIGTTAEGGTGVLEPAVCARCARVTLVPSAGVEMPPACP